MRKNFKNVWFLASTLILLNIACTEQANISTKNNKKQVQDIVREANISYDIDQWQSGDPYVPLMVSNGIVGGSFDHMGFQSTPNSDYPQGRTVLGYVDNYYEHDPTTRQIQMPIAYVTAQFADGTTIDQMYGSENYRQELDLYTAVLTTKYNLFGETEVVAFAHQTKPNLFVMKIKRNPESTEKELVVTVNAETSRAQNNQFAWKGDPIQVTFDAKPSKVYVNSKTNLSETNWIVDVTPGTGISIENNNINLHLKENETVIKFLMLRDDAAKEDVLAQGFQELYNSHVANWADAWETSWIDFPDDIVQKIWTRTKYYTVSHFPLITEKAMMPTGLNVNIWGFTFPQDVYYVAENLPRLGHFERSEKALKYWLDILPEVKAYAQRTMHLEGAYYPWNPPFTDWDRYERNGVVSPDSYQLHNSAYVAAMVWHYFKYSNDTAFLQEYFPILEGVWQYYRNISEPNKQGRFDVYHQFARGQDEASTTEGKLRNLLCASYSAEYTARNYLKATNILNTGNESLIQSATEILDAGYERETLLSDEGWYVTYQGDDRPYHSQKHPVQLNPITYVPMPDMCGAGSPVLKAWENRYNLTEEANKPITKGWTFGQFILASTRLKDVDAIKKDLRTIQIARGADPRWIQFYESSFWPGWHMNKAYYLPMMGLYLQAFTDHVVQDWEGYVNIFPVVWPEWKDEQISFAGIHTLNGVSVSGNYNKGDVEITLTPNGAGQVELMVYEDFGTLSVSGQAEGPSTFNPKEKVILSFSGDEVIKIKN